MKKPASLAILLAAVLLAACQPKPAVEEIIQAAGGSYKAVSADQLNGMLRDKDFTLINVHVPFAGNLPQTDMSVPYDQIDRSLAKLPSNKNAKIVLYCRSGRMSQIAAEKLVALGYTNIWELKDGMAGWEAAGYKIEK